MKTNSQGRKMNLMQVESESRCSFDFHGLIFLCEYVLEGMIASVAKATRNQQTSSTQQASGSAGGLQRRAATQGKSLQGFILIKQHND